MKEIIEEILPLWGIENGQLLQIYPSAWEINHSYILKVHDEKKQLERNIKISEILLDCTIPVAKIVLTKAGEKYIEHKKCYFLMSKNYGGVIFLILETRQLPGRWGVRCVPFYTKLRKRY